MLRKEKAEKKHYKNDYRVDIANGGAYIYMRCRHCKSRMSFKWCGEEELYRLNAFNNIHNHKYEFGMEQQYLDWIEKLPLNMELATAKDIALKNFHVSASKFYHTYQR
ncbi:MAG: hypothetical protein KBC84_10505 [Proteobacteria bacterium]|jgi:ATP-dependent Lon protease|nr:hypothetical protein [Pseudomonadota bacterium]